MSKYFSDSELACKCDRGDKCDAAPMNMETVMKLDGMRMELGEAMIITSARRCAYWNQKCNGADNSQHLDGKAVDIKTKGGVHTARLISLAIKHGFTAVGVAKGFIHIDIRSGPTIFFGY